MKRIVIIYGLIAGAIVSLIMVTTQPLYEQGTLNFDNGMVIGYASMVIALSMIFFGVKTYRDQHLKGSITFWNAFKMGILISLIAGVMYCLTWEIYFQSTGGDFMAKYSEHYVQRIAAEGASAAEIEEAKNYMKSMSDMYENPIIRFGFTMMEILPVGIVISIICAGLLRKTEFLPDNVNA